MQDEKKEIVEDSGESKQDTTETNVPRSDTITIVSYQNAILKIVSTALPIVGSLTFSIGIILAGMMMGQLGDGESEHEDYLGASDLMTTELYTLMVISCSLLYSICIATGTEYGKTKRRSSDSTPPGLDDPSPHAQIAKIFKNGLYLAGFCSPTPMIIMLFTKSILTNWFGQEEESSDLAEQYLRTYSWATPFVLINIASEQVLFGLEKQNAAFIIGAINFVLGSALAYALCFWTPLGLVGVALGYAVLALSSSISYLSYLKNSKSLQSLRLYQSSWKPDLTTLKQLLQIGWPITLTFFGEVCASFTINLFCGWLGKTELASQNIASQLIFFGMIPIIATTQATGAEVARSAGEDQVVNARRYGHSGVLVSFLLLATLSLPLAFYPEIAGYLYASTGDEGIMSTITKLLPITAAGVLFDSVRNTSTGALRGLQDVTIPAILSITSLWIGVLTAYLLGFNTALGINGVAAGYTLGLGIGAIALFTRWNSKSNSLIATNMGQDSLSTESCSCNWCPALFNQNIDSLKEALIPKNERPKHINSSP